MNYYLIAKLLHIVGALGFFMAFGVEVLSLWQARNATTSAQVRERLQISSSTQRLGPLSMLMILISGFTMMAIARIGSAWLIVAFGALILIVMLGLALTAPRMAAIRRALTTENGPVSSSLHGLLHNSLLSLSMHMRATIALGIVVLMTVKPDLLGSLIVIGVAIILGLAFSLPVRGRDQEKVQERLVPARQADKRYCDFSLVNVQEFFSFLRLIDHILNGKSNRKQIETVDRKRVKRHLLRMPIITLKSKIAG